MACMGAHMEGHSMPRMGALDALGPSTVVPPWLSKLRFTSQVRA